MKISTHLDHQTVLANHLQPIHFALRLEADAYEGPSKQPAAFGVVLDRSGSMEGAAIDHAKSAVALMIKHLRPQDHFTLIAFDDEAHTLIPLQPAVRKAEFLHLVQSIAAGGSTNLTGGWMLGRDELRKAPPGANRRLLLLSDGQLNMGITEPPIVRQIVVSGLEKEGVRTSCLGFGSEYNEDLMAELARATHGEFHDADSPEKLPMIFTAELEGLQRLSAQNVRLRLRRLDFCRAWLPLGEYPAIDLPDGRVEFALGDLVAGEERVACFAVQVLPFPMIEGKPVFRLEGEELLGVEVVYDEVGKSDVASRVCTQTVRIQGTQEPGKVKLDGEVVQWVALQKAGRVVQEATHKLDAGLDTEALGLLEAELGQLSGYGAGEGVSDAARMLREMAAKIQAEGWNARERKAAQYRSAKFQRLSSAGPWTLDEAAPGFKKRRKS